MGIVRVEETTRVIVFGLLSDRGMGYTHGFKGGVCERDSASDPFFRVWMIMSRWKKKQRCCHLDKGNSPDFEVCLLGLFWSMECLPTIEVVDYKFLRGWSNFYAARGLRVIVSWSLGGSGNEFLVLWSLTKMKQKFIMNDQHQMNSCTTCILHKMVIAVLVAFNPWESSDCAKIGGLYVPGPGMHLIRVFQVHLHAMLEDLGLG